MTEPNSSRPSRSIAAQLFDLAWPIIGLNVLNVLALAVDTAMCGRLPDSAAILTALGFATQFVWLILVFQIGLVVGTVALIARANGAGDTARTEDVLVQSTQLTITLGLVIAIAGNLFGPDLLALLGASPRSIELAMPYLEVVMTGAVFYYLNVLYGAVMRGVQSTRIPFQVALLTNVLNFAINYCLILGNLGFPRLGVQGAAIGTVASYAVGTMIYVALLRRETIPGVKLPLRPKAFKLSLVRELIDVGFPAALDLLILNAGFLSIVGMLGRLDEVAVAAHGMGLRVQALAFVPGMSIAQATAAMVGNALGAGDPDRARAVTRSSIAMSTTIMAVLAGTIIGFAYPMVAIFDVDPGTHLEALTVEWMRLLGYCMPIAGVHIAFVGCLQGSGSTYSSLSINLAGTAFQVPLSYLLGFPLAMGVTGVWLAFPLSFLIKGGLGYALYRRGKWARTGLSARRGS